MSSREDDLALHKEILVARASLCRLKIRFQVNTLRQSLSWPAMGASLVRSPPLRDAVFLLAAEGLGRYRVAHWLAVAARILAVAKLTRLALALLRKPAASPTDPPAP